MISDQEIVYDEFDRMEVGIVFDGAKECATAGTAKIENWRRNCSGSTTIKYHDNNTTVHTTFLPYAVTLLVDTTSI